MVIPDSLLLKAVESSANEIEATLRIDLDNYREDGSNFGPLLEKC